MTNIEEDFSEQVGRALGEVLNFVPAITGDQIVREVEAMRGVEDELLAASRKVLRALIEILRGCVQALQSQDSFEVRRLRTELESMGDVLSLEYMDCSSPPRPIVERRARKGGER